jgi:SOS-response transcriptional repressor LexA
MISMKREKSQKVQLRAFLPVSLVDLAEGLAGGIGGTRGTFKEVVGASILMFADADSATRKQYLLRLLGVERGLEDINELKRAALGPYVILRKIRGRGRERAAPETAPVLGLHNEAPEHPDGTVIPVLNRVAAGQAMEATDMGFPPGGADLYVELPRELMRIGPRAYGLTVDGDSMSPDYQHGDIVVVDPDISSEGSAPVMGIAIYGEDRMSVFKQVVRDKTQVELRSLNKRFPTIHVDSPEVHAVHSVIACVKITSN